MNPLRILSNDRNLLRTATLTPSSVEPADNAAIAVDTPRRTGSASVALTGSYTGAEDATVELKVVDVTADVKRASTPVLVGAGSGTLTDITVSGFATQAVRVQLKDIGIPIINAAIDFEGVKIVARTPGAGGNSIHLNVDQSGLTFTPSNFSLLADLKAGQGGPTTGLTGPAWDWDAAVLGVDNIIPSTAKRVSFGADKTVYLQYKAYGAGDWRYYFVPALLRDIPADTPINFVTGGRTVTITDDITPEVYAAIATVYDLLHAVRETSALVTVDGIVANDRSPTGQAARDLLVRTDAYAQPSFGTGPRYATGFDNVFVAPDAGTENVIARCYAITASDHPQARLGRERWQVKSVLSGAVADAVTGVPYLTSKWGFTIPERYPPGYGTVLRGEFSVVGITYAGRTGAEIKPPICPVSLTLGPAAVDQTITLTYSQRSRGDCDCSGLPAPNLETSCVGLDGGGAAVAYQSDTIVRLISLRQWFAQLVRAETAAPNDVSEAVAKQDGMLTTPGQAIISALGTGFVATQATLSIKDVVDKFEDVAALIDPLSPSSPASYREAGFTVWDAAALELKTDVANFIAAESPSPGPVYSIPSDRYLARLAQALTSAGLSPLGKFSASSQLVSADGCWRDWGDDLWWEVVGSNGGGYAPLFTNRPFFSCQTDINGALRATHEFALQLNVKCTGDLKVGDSVTLKIGNASWPATYQVGDTLTLPVIAARDRYLAGGQDGTTVQQWNVTGVNPMAVYTLDTASPAPYSSGGLGFQINQGGVPFKVGDRFDFAIEGGHFQWRFNAGAWSADIAIPEGAILLASGLSADFGSGNAPSFAVDDTYAYRVLQPRRASNLQTPGPEAWKWGASSPASADILFDLGGVHDIPNFALALHTLPAGCTLTLEGAATLASPWSADWTETLTRREGPIYAEFSHSARYLRLSITAAPDAAIGYAFCGPALITELSASLDSLARLYNIKRGAGGIYQAGRYLGKATSGQLTWEGLSEAEVMAVMAVTDYLKAQGDQPLIVIPNVTRPEEAFLGQVSDHIAWPDIPARNAGVDRRYPMALPLTGVYFR